MREDEEVSAPRRQPWAAVGHAVGHVVLAVPLALLFAFLWVGLALSLLVVGLWLLRAIVAGVAALSLTHGHVAQSMLGRPVPVAVPVPDPGLGAVRQLRRWAGTAVLWRLMAWMCFALTVGLVLSTLAVLAPLAAGALVVVGIVLVSVDPGQYALVPAVGWPLAAAVAVLWWRYADDVVRLRCRIEAAVLAPDPATLLAQRVADLTTSRAESVDHSASELRRIERDLHDGAQARLVALGMNLGLVSDLMEQDPEAARQLLDEARGTTGAALGDLRSVVRGIHPPVLADRGLVGAVQALALDMGLPVTVTASLPERPPAPVETAVYFAVSECLANVGKHAGASRASVDVARSDNAVVVTVVDDGHGGADPARGSGLRGVMRRLAAFDGTMRVTSPAGGPTEITLEVPCVWSSPKTTPSSGTG